MSSRMKSIPNPPCFFKVMINDFREKLTLPKAFIMAFNGNVPKKFTLITPTMKSWMISVRKTGNDYILCNEWKMFAEDHALELGDFLVFRCKSTTEFNVKIFGKNACEKEVCKEATPELASDYPSFSVTIPFTDLAFYSNMIIPYNFATKYLKHKALEVTAPEVTLRVANVANWYLRYTVGAHHRLVAGWRDFVYGNNLKGGDTLKFELVNRNQIEFKVSISRYVLE